MTGARARGAEEKRARRRQLLAAAAGLLDGSGYAATTMAEIAATAGLAKGTTYLYYRSKEDLFLDVLLDAIAEWSAAANVELAALRDDRPEAVAATLAAGVARRTRLVRLLSVRHTLLERPGGSSAALAFELSQLEAQGPLAMQLEERLPWLGLGGGLLLLRRLLALAAGLADLAAPNAPAREAVAARPEASRLASDFEAELASCAATLLRGWRPSAEAPPSGAGAGS